jgi:hypothetical protein
MTVDIQCPFAGGSCRHAGYNYNIESEPIYEKIGGIKVLVSQHVHAVQDKRGVFCNDIGKYLCDIQTCEMLTSRDAQPQPVISQMKATRKKKPSLNDEVLKIPKITKQMCLYDAG